MTPARRTLLIAVLIVVSALLSACSDGVPDLEQSADVRLDDALAERDGRPSIRVISPTDGETVTSPFSMIVEVEGINLAAAGATRDGEAHWHVLVDRGCVPAGEVLPREAFAIHIGDGGATAEINLPRGERELCVQLGDGFHVAIDVSETLSVTIVEQDDASAR